MDRAITYIMLVLGGQDITSKLTRVGRSIGNSQPVRAMAAGLSSAGRAVKSAVWSSDEEDDQDEDDMGKEEHCVSLEIDRKVAWKGVDGCDEAFWAEAAEGTLVWGVADEFILRNQNKLVPTVKRGDMVYGGTICGTRRSNKGGDRKVCFQYALPTSLIIPQDEGGGAGSGGGDGDGPHCPCAEHGSFPYFNCPDIAKQIYVHVSGHRMARKQQQEECRSLPVDAGVQYFYDKSITARYEGKKSDVNVRTCPATDIVT